VGSAHQFRLLLGTVCQLDGRGIRRNPPRLAGELRRDRGVPGHASASPGSAPPARRSR